MTILWKLVLSIIASTTRTTNSSTEPYLVFELYHPQLPYVRSASHHQHHHPNRTDPNLSTLKIIMQMSNSKFSPTTGGTAGVLSTPPIRIKHHRHSTHGELMIPSNLTYYTPQHKRHSSADSASGTGAGEAPLVRPILSEKRSPVNKNVQQINSEEEASVLSRYPFHGNRALPSSRVEENTPGPTNIPLNMTHRPQQRWSLIDVNNNRVEDQGDPSEIDLMLQPVRDCSRRGIPAQRSVLIPHVGEIRVGGKQKRQLSSIRSHSSQHKIHYKSPPMKRYSNVYDYAYMSDPSLNAIYEDEDSQ